MQLEQVIDLMRKVPLFSSISARDFEHLAPYVKTGEFKKDQTVVSMGEEGDSMYIIVDGSMKVYQMDDDGKQIVIAILHAGDHFGEMSLIDRKPRSAWLAAREPSKVLVLHYSNFNDMMQKSHTFCLSIMGALTDRLRSANLKIQSLALMDVYGRVAQLLMEMSVERDGIRMVLEPITHQDVADQVGCTREMVGKVLRNLVTGGYISYTDKKRIIINGDG